MRTIKTVVAAVIATSCFSGMVLAGTVDWVAQGAYLTRADGTTLTDGTTVGSEAFIEMGYFTITDGAVIAGKTDPATLSGSFVVLQTDMVGDFGGSPDQANGLWGSEFNGSFDSGTGNGAFHAAVGKNIYVWAFNGNAFNTGGEQGIYKFAGTFPSDTPTIGAGGAELAELLTGGTILAGSIGAGTVNGALGDMGHINLETIPEPSTYLLVISGLLGMLAVRRRRS